ncbi:MAG: NTP transferase domain-containing protein [Bacteroidaceae bacterium]|nr:NTP transferase domain-containing protein [Bacteroidaceae bacterium]
MKFAIISAGEGSRLSQEGIQVPKPLVRLNGEAMIDRLIRIFTDCEAEEVVVIVNNLTSLVQEHLNRMDSKVPLKVVVKTTPSSMHSFYELSPYLGEGKFCLTTVDTVFREDEFKEYIEEYRSSDYDGMMAVTDFIDDEKPLYVSTNKKLDITGFYDSMEDFLQNEANQVQHAECRFISGGIYCLDGKSIQTLHRCMEQGMSRMRNFQRQLVADGLRLKARPFSKILDVDHASDIVKAEEFLISSTK